MKQLNSVLDYIYCDVYRKLVIYLYELGDKPNQKNYICSYIVILGYETPIYSIKNHIMYQEYSSFKNNPTIILWNTRVRILPYAAALDNTTMAVGFYSEIWIYFP